MQPEKKSVTNSELYQQNDEIGNSTSLQVKW